MAALPERKETGAHMRAKEGQSDGWEDYIFTLVKIGVRERLTPAPTTGQIDGLLGSSSKSWPSRLWPVLHYKLPEAWEEQGRDRSAAAARRRNMNTGEAHRVKNRKTMRLEVANGQEIDDTRHFRAGQGTLHSSNHCTTAPHLPFRNRANLISNGRAAILYSIPLFPTTHFAIAIKIAAIHNDTAPPPVLICLYRPPVHGQDRPKSRAPFDAFITQAPTPQK